MPGVDSHNTVAALADKLLQKGGKRSATNGSIRARCPVHGGEDDLNFVLFDSGNGFCHSQCGFVSVERLGTIFDVDVSNLSGMRVEAFLSHYNFPSQLAMIYQLEDQNPKNGKPFVSIPYCDENGNKLFYRRRFTLEK